MITVVVAASLGGLHGLLAVMAAGVVFCGWRWLCLQRLGGITGDTCGALAEAIEATVLVATVLGS